MGAPGDQLNPHLGEILPAGQNLIVQNGLLDALSRLLYDVGFPLLLVPQQQILKGSGLFLRAAVDDRQIFFLEKILPDLPGQLRGGLRGDGQHHKPGYHPVQPVDGAHLMGRQIQSLPHQLRHTSRLVGGKHPGRFDTNHNGIIVIQNIHKKLPCFLFMVTNLR